MSQTAQSSAPGSVEENSGEPSSVRWHILALLAALCFISHFNRSSMSVAGNDRIMDQFSIAPVKMGTVYSAFLLVYSICMIPGGFFIDRFGPRRALMVVGFGSALFGALTGATGWCFATGSSVLWALLLVRGTMGLLSAPLHPSRAQATANWFPLSQRSLANGIVTGASIVGVACSYPGFGALIRWMDWPSAFVTSAVVMALLTWVWAFYATDRPAAHRNVNAAERRRIESAAELDEPGQERGSSNWRDLLRNRSLLFLTLSYAAVGYFQYLFDYWMQYDFDRVLHLGGTASKYYASIPQLALALTMPLGGGLADGLARRVGLGRGRALVSGMGMLLSAGMLGLGVLAREPVWIVIWFTLAMGALGASEGPFWATAVELGGRRGGTAAAILNTGGNLGGVLAPVLTPWVSGHLGWPWGISLGGIICFLGALCWLRVDPDQHSRGTTIKTR